MTTAFRCSTASQEQAEPQLGTASTVPAFLLVEAPGPWGVDAVRDSRLPDEVKRWLSRLEPEHKVRPLLIRGHGRSESTTTRVFAAFVRTDRPWVETTELSDVREVLDLDVTGLARDQSPGLTPYDEPLFLVCTHGKHDACCAEQGRPLCKALSAIAPDSAWEVSHIGGDRFAANLLVLPEGLYYGRLTPADASDFVTAHREGRLDVEHLRGRCAYSFPVQAAEIYLRRHLGVDSATAFPRLSSGHAGTESVVVFEVLGERWEVRVDTTRGASRQLTCGAERLGRALVHRLVSLRSLG